MPSYVNIGAWVGPRTMVDTWATVGSCAQIGADVHLAGGVGIGGVLEPPQARPVIVEDGAFIGSRASSSRGRSSARAPFWARTSSLTASTPVIDVTGRGARRAPRLRAAALGRRAGDAAQGVPGGTFELACALIVGRRSEATDLKTSLNDALREHGVGARRGRSRP